MDNVNHRRVLTANCQTNIKCSNSINTSKYSIFTFVFIFLYEQFRKYSNFFFLIISLFEQIPKISPTGRYGTLFPLSLILTVSAIREIIEDLYRKKSDHKINNNTTQVLKRRNELDPNWTETKWNNVSVGDIVRVHQNETFPADIFLLASSEEIASICYVETSNLDGETNLKVKQSLTETCKLTDVNSLMETNFSIEFELPNQNFYEFVGNLKLDNDVTIPISIDQLLLRGSQLRNTAWIHGIVIYTGKETKLMKNSNRPPLKRSLIEKSTNRFMLILFIGLFVMSFLSTGLCELWYWESLTNHWYLKHDENSTRIFLNLLMFILLYNNLIPISLQVSLEMSKFVQGFFIKWDVEMFDEEKNFKARARTSNLNEELGLVKYVFTDKTGTLTRNQMELKSCSIAGVSYSSSSDDSALLAARLKDLSKNKYYDEFFTCITSCHSVIPEMNASTNQIDYQASSPDENALLIYAQQNKIIFHTRQQNKLKIKYISEEREYEVLNILEFSSERKRMSVILMDKYGDIRLYCKGADDVILPRLARQGQEFKSQTINQLIEFANQGLRTLVISFKQISKEDYLIWHEIYEKASTSFEDRDEKIRQAAELIENDLRILGATAVEDKLQQEVPETISKLKRAGMEIWMLTGDKLETAINIGYSCRLLTTNTDLIQLVDESQIEDTFKRHSRSFEIVNEFENRRKCSLIISGNVLPIVLSPYWVDSFYKMAVSCDAVICCRATPKDKAQVVDIIKKRSQCVTLAIGDGANDVSMIQTANIGIGLYGKEGTQALSASDYSIGQFRFLSRLLLVHGTWNYKRVCNTIMYSFYKNICLYFIEFWFAFYNGFSGQILFDSSQISLFNVFFTSSPQLVLAMFDRSTSESTLMEFPELYRLNLNKKEFSQKTFWLSLLNSFVHSILVFFMCYGMINGDITRSDGKIGDHYYFGNYAFTYCVIVVCLKAIIQTDSLTQMNLISTSGSLFNCFFFLFGYSYVWPKFNTGIEMCRQAENVYGTPIFWLGVILVPFTTLLPDLVIRIFKQNFRKSLHQIILENRISLSRNVSIDDNYK